MKLLDIFKKRDTEDVTEKGRKSVDIKELEIYSGMRVLVETPDGQLLFLADLQDPYGGTARLFQCSDGETVSDEGNSGETEHMQVKLRGYNNHTRKAVLMEGIITPGDRHIWQIERLTVTSVENERNYFRLNTDINGMITAAERETVEERPCKLLNISMGGVSISSRDRYQKGDVFLLKVKLLENKADVVLYCEVLRVAEKSGAMFEYGCRFLNLAKADREQISQRISAAEQ